MRSIQSAFECAIRSAGYAITGGGVVLVLAAQSPVLRAQNPRTSPFIEASCLGFGAARSERQAATGTIRFIGSEVGRPIPNPAGVSDSPLAAARSYLATCGSLFGLDQPERDLQATEVKPVDGGRSVVRFRQTHQGIPVIAGELVVQVDAQRNILTVAGETLPQPIVPTTPTITADEAARVAIDVVVKNYNVNAANLRTSTPELWIYNPTLLAPGDGPTSLVWRMDVAPQDLSPIRELVLIDAHQGSLRLHFNQIHAARDRQTYTAGNGTILPGAFVCNESNPACAGGDTHAIGAHLGAGETYNFYFTMHGRDGINNGGMTMVSTVHFSVNYFNAFWNGNQMVYGDAAGFPLADDVVGHELTHGVTQYTSELFYYYQSGAINESLSDIWGEFVDQTNGRGTDTTAVKWLMGEDIAGAGAIRNMSNPPAFGNPDKMTSPFYYVDDGDNGGVHYNSGVNNKAAFLMTDGGTFNGHTVVGLGIAKVAKIYYEVQTNFLTSGADYADLYNALFQACTNLVGTSGITVGDCQQVRNATLAVEMNSEPIPDFNTEASVCPVGITPTNIFFDDFESIPVNWVTSNVLRFYWAAFNAHSGQNSFYGDDFPAAISDTNVQMSTDVHIPSNAFLHFAHAYGFEGSNYDGGVLEYSTNAGLTWNDAGSLFEVNGYDGTINNSYSNPLGGRQGFLDDSHGYISSRLNLFPLAGQNVRFRWRMGLDSSFYDWGWWLDDIRIYTCGPAPLTVSSLTADAGFPVPVGTPVTWTAAATGGTAPYSFKFFVYDGFTWTVGQDWSSSNTWTWMPMVSSTYRVQVWVRNAGSSAPYDAYGDAGPITIVPPPPLTITALTATPPAPVPINTMVTWTVAASGGTGPYTYKFWIFDGTTWSLGRDWSPSNTWTWTPLTGGRYNIQVWARNAGSVAPYDAWREASPYVVNGPPPLTVTSLTANQVFPLPLGTPVNWTAAATGGTGPYTFKFFVYNGTTWTVGQDWGAANSFAWTPPAQGTYYFQVWARNAGSSTAYDAYHQVGPYNVTAPSPLTVTSLVADRVFPVPAGTPVTWTGLARGGSGPYSYKFFVYNGATWAVEQDWSPSSTWMWVPPAAGTYLIQMWVRNAGSTAPYDSYIGLGPVTIGASAPLVVTSFTPSNSPIVGTPTTLTAVATGGVGPYTYKFFVYNGTTWSVGQDWSAASNFSWIPPTSGSYLFQVWVRSAGSVTPWDAVLGLGPIIVSSFDGRPDVSMRVLSNEDTRPAGKMAFPFAEGGGHRMRR